MRRFLKFAHELGGVGLMGAVLAHMVLSYRAEGLPPVEHAAMRQAILAIAEYLLVPSLLLVLFSGLVAMALHRGFHNAGWAWVKLATTAVILEGTLLGVTAPATTGAEVAAELAAGDTTNLAMMDDIVRHERGGLWVIVFLSVVNIAFAVWRPRLRRRQKAEASERAGYVSARSHSTYSSSESSGLGSTVTISMLLISSEDQLSNSTIFKIPPAIS